MKALLLTAVFLAAGQWQIFGEVHSEKHKCKQAKDLLTAASICMQRHDSYGAVKQLRRVAELGLTSRQGMTYTADAEELIGTELMKEYRFAEADSSLARCFEIRRSLLGENDAYTLLAGREQAEVWLNEGRIADAEYLCSQVLEAQVSQFGPTDFQYLESLVLLSQIYFAKGEQAEADLLMQNCIAYTSAKYGAQSAEVGYLLNLRGWEREKIGSLAEAFESYESAYQIAIHQRVLHGREIYTVLEHNCLIACANIVNVQALDYLDHRDSEFERALIAGVQAADCPVSYISAMTALARLRQKQGASLEARRLLDEAWRSHRFEGGYSPADLFRLGMAYGDITRAQGDYRRAISSYQFALDALEPVNTARRPVYLKMLVPEERIADCKAKLGDLDGARAEYMQLCSQSESIAGAGSSLNERYQSLLFEFCNNNWAEIHRAMSQYSQSFEEPGSGKLVFYESFDTLDEHLGHP